MMQKSPSLLLIMLLVMASPAVSIAGSGPGSTTVVAPATPSGTAAITPGAVANDSPLKANGLSSAERRALGLPLDEECPPDQILQTNGDDEKFVAALPTDVYAAIHAYVKEARGRDFNAQGNIYAARKVGAYILLWVNEPQVDDGGFELIYSIADKRIAGSFFAGYKG